MSFDRFFDSYLTTALWSSNDESDESGGEPFDANYSVSDFAPETKEHLRDEAQDFYDKYNAHWKDDGLAGHDFWLTRNGHGAGFWDKEDKYGEADAALLTKASKKYGEENLYLDDEGQIRAQRETVTRRSR